jgi:ribosomal protein S24E
MGKFKILDELEKELIERGEAIIFHVEHPDTLEEDKEMLKRELVETAFRLADVLLIQKIVKDKS